MKGCPSEIWLDERIAKLQPGQPNQDSNVKQVRYFSEDKVRELAAQAAGKLPEFFVQIEAIGPAQVLGLTNYGRLFKYNGSTTWDEIDVPKFAGVENENLEKGTGSAN